MRPVRRGGSPVEGDFAPYSNALPYLIARMGRYCSYCERPISTQLAVEHIQPKGLPDYSMLIGRWTNYLLGCVNCNSTKKDKDVLLDKVFLPDRDNTFAAFTYRPDGYIAPSPQAVAAGLASTAQATLSLTGLDKKPQDFTDENGRRVALDRVTQRMEVWAVAEEVKSTIAANPALEAVKQGAIRIAQFSGFFSIWMTVFQNDAEMRGRLIDAFPGTCASGCFNAAGETVSPAPNPDQLTGGGKL